MNISILSQHIHNQPKALAPQSMHGWVKIVIWVLIRKSLPSIETSNMSEGRSNGGKPKSISESKEHTQINFALLLILCIIDLKTVIDNCVYVIQLSFACEQMRWEYGEPICAINIESPVCYRNHNVDYQSIANKDINNGEERRDERTEQEWCNSTPVKCDGSKS